MNASQAKEISRQSMDKIMAKRNKKELRKIVCKMVPNAARRGYHSVKVPLWIAHDPNLVKQLQAEGFVVDTTTTNKKDKYDRDIEVCFVAW